jgi:hypothetical protein
MSIGDNINNLPKFYNGLAKVLEECSLKIEGFLELQQKEELKEKAKSILDYYYNNLEKLESKPNKEGYYTVFTSKEEGIEYYLLYKKIGNQLYWDDNTLINNKKLVLFSLENTSNFTLNMLLNYSYFNILSLHEDNTKLTLEEYINKPRIPQDAIDKYLHIIEENNKFAYELKEEAKSPSTENLSDITEVYQNSSKGGKKTTYKLNGEKVVLLHKNKKVQRSIYVKGNGKTKYCIIDKEYVLLSKVKNKIQ